jgi:hypothetical protein
VASADDQGLSPIPCTFHIPQRKPLPPQAIRCTIDINDRLLPERDPDDAVGIGMRALDAPHHLVDGFDRGLPEGVNVRVGDVSEVDGTADAVLDVMRFPSPLVGFQEGADKSPHSLFRFEGIRKKSTYLSRRIIPLRFWKPRSAGAC